MSLKFRKRFFRALIVLVVLVGLIGWVAWYKLLREEPEARWANENERFKYGTIGAEDARGMPFWIWVVLPRIFPEYLPGPGGYKSFGIVWEEGHEMPVGFTKRVVGFARVANNCALCHAGTWRANEEDALHVVPGAPSHTINVQGMLRFLANCGNDPRFNADQILTEIAQNTKLSFLDRQLYRFVLIPLTRSALQKEGRQLAWMNRPGSPEWGPGRDDSMNITKYFLTSLPVDDTTGQADFPSNWNLKVRKGTNLFLSWGCDTPAVRSVVIDSALGVGAAPDTNNPIDRLIWKFSRRAWLEKRAEELDHYLSDLPPPKYPFAIDVNLAATGRPIYNRLCADCHEPGKPRANRPIPLNEIRTDRNRSDTWSQAAADQANAAVKGIGIIRPDMVKQEGYQGIPLDGIWMRAPYLHNGSVPNLRQLLEPENLRDKVFYRGYDVYDQQNVGFITSGPAAAHNGWRLDTAIRGNGNQGHEYGTALTNEDKRALLEYLKTL